MLPGRLGFRFALEALFLVLLAIGAGLADLRPAYIVLVMAIAWVLVAIVEFTAERISATPFTYLLPQRSEPPADEAEAAWPLPEERTIVAPPERAEPEPEPEPELVSAPDPEADPSLRQRQCRRCRRWLRPPSLPPTTSRTVGGARSCAGASRTRRRSRRDTSNRSPSRSRSWCPGPEPDPEPASKPVPALPAVAVDAEPAADDEPRPRRRSLLRLREPDAEAEPPRHVEPEPEPEPTPALPAVAEEPEPAADEEPRQGRLRSLLRLRSRRWSPSRHLRRDT